MLFYILLFPFLCFFNFFIMGSPSDMPLKQLTESSTLGRQTSYGSLEDKKDTLVIQISEEPKEPPHESTVTLKPRQRCSCDPSVAIATGFCITLSTFVTWALANDFLLDR